MPFLIVQRYNGSQSALTRSSPADGEKNLHRRIFLFKLVLPFSIFVRSYSSLPTLQGWAAVESIGTTRIRHTQALWTQGVTANNR
ncbi:hypothetical protein [Prevotella rectalis]|uniref:hypothetical protein n=1 Tax=Prevotella rectalis TaxID=2219999 RepID=UPI0013EF0E70|nr:hypothetical protein [Prevotella brunnea]